METITTLGPVILISLVVALVVAVVLVRRRRGGLEGMIRRTEGRAGTRGRARGVEPADRLAQARRTLEGEIAALRTLIVDLGLRLDEVRRISTLAAKDIDATMARLSALLDEAVAAIESAERDTASAESVAGGRDGGRLLALADAADALAGRVHDAVLAVRAQRVMRKWNAKRLAEAWERERKAGNREAAAEAAARDARER